MSSFNLKSIQIEQIIESIGILITTFSSELPTSNLIRQSLKYLQLEIGISIPIFTMSYSNFKHLCTKGWLTSIWRSLSLYNLNLHLPLSYYLISIIHNNRSIIKEVFKARYLSKEQHYLINIIRLKLKVFFISDLLESGTNWIKECYWKGRSNKFSKSKYL